MKKRILSVVLVLSMMVSFMPIIASAATSGTCGNNLTWKLDNGTLTISGTGEMKNYSVNLNQSTPWHSNIKSIKSVVIEKGVMNIGDYAFYDCSSLTSITIPNNVTSIGASTFENCSNLTSITIPKNVTIIGGYAFKKCSNLTSITISTSVTDIYEYAFENCTNLKDVYYTGTKAEWEKMDIDNNGNDDLLNATIHYSDVALSTIYSADKVSTQITSGKLKITLNVDDNINNATVYVAFRNNGKIVDVKKATLSNLKAEVSLSNKTYTDMNIYIWNSRQQPYTYVKNIKK